MTGSTITINNQKYTFEEGETILALARRNAIFIPTLCFLDGLTVVGSCRLCMVEVKGISNPVTACTTKARDGMEIYTDSSFLQEHRRKILEMLFASGHHICAACIANGHCELQLMAQRAGVDSINFPHRTPMADVDMTHPRFGFDPNRCILCTRCVRTCDEIEGAQVWQVIGRGSDARVAPNMGEPWGESDFCKTCGKCVQSCPTGSIFDKYQNVGHMKKDCTLVARILHPEKES
jgi:bidirectional [NiFe] hydrogenase diaphorase subunit